MNRTENEAFDLIDECAKNINSGNVNSFGLFFKHVTRRPPKFRKAEDFTSFIFKQGGYKLYSNEFIINKISKRFKFSKSREWEGKVKNVRVFRSRGEWYILRRGIAELESICKTGHRVAAAG